ncbi:HAMP domain-containing protein [Aggregatilinea lenta]|uniref:HAMP domain-containing protein n=1 Tax=Aggregatilinea lenta TaxID=913108 RepID=UPI0013C2A6EC|nr:HAMP domain-containing protein [Aggregatilinea lenta]
MRHRLEQQWSALRLGTRFALILLVTMLVGTTLSGAVLVLLLSGDDPVAVQGTGGAAALAGLLLVVNVGVVLLASALLRWLVVRPVEQIAAVARRIAVGELLVPPGDADALIALAERGDELGDLARGFQDMRREVQRREVRLAQEVEQLRIEINAAQREQQVSEITETDYFQQLQSKVRALRRSVTR